MVSPGKSFDDLDETVGVDLENTVGSVSMSLSPNKPVITKESLNTYNWYKQIEFDSTLHDIHRAIYCKDDGDVLVDQLTAEAEACHDVSRRNQVTREKLRMTISALDCKRMLLDTQLTTYMMLHPAEATPEGPDSRDHTLKILNEIKHLGVDAKKDFLEWRAYNTLALQAATSLNTLYPTSPNLLMAGIKEKIPRIKTFEILSKGTSRIVLPSKGKLKAAVLKAATQRRANMSSKLVPETRRQSLRSRKRYNIIEVLSDAIHSHEVKTEEEVSEELNVTGERQLISMTLRISGVFCSVTFYWNATEEKLRIKVYEPSQDSMYVIRLSEEETRIIFENNLDMSILSLDSLSVCKALAALLTFERLPRPIALQIFSDAKEMGSMYEACKHVGVMDSASQAYTTQVLSIRTQSNVLVSCAVASKLE